MNKIIRLFCVMAALTAFTACDEGKYYLDHSDDDPAYDGPGEDVTEKITLKIANFNLRVPSSDGDDNTWALRKERIVKRITDYDFDIFGTEEGLKYMLDELSGAMSGYAWFGAGRSNGSDEGGEHSSIFYKVDKYELLDHGDFWLSPTPDVAGSKGWDAALTRICSWGKFREKKSGKTFLHLNAHFDHAGVQARTNSAALMLERAAALGSSALPVFFTGDFNCNPDTEAYATLVSGSMQDARTATETEPKGTEYTYHAFSPSTDSGYRLDYIFASAGVRVLSYTCINDDITEGHCASDHFPIMAVVSF